MNPRLELLNEMAQWLTPETLAAIVAELNGGEDRLTYNMSLAANIFTMQLEALVGSDADMMINEAAIDLHR